MPPKTMAPKPATTMAPPSERKKFMLRGRGAELVHATAFWIATVVTGSTVPIPSPTAVSAVSTSGQRQAAQAAPPGRAAPSVATTRPPTGRRR